MVLVVNTKRDKSGYTNLNESTKTTEKWNINSGRDEAILRSKAEQFPIYSKHTN